MVSHVGTEIRSERRTGHPPGSSSASAGASPARAARRTCLAERGQSRSCLSSLGPPDVGCQLGAAGSDVIASTGRSAALFTGIHLKRAVLYRCSGIRRQGAAVDVAR